jgi:glycerophosphoryl diester phosphodiesterase
VSILLDPHAKPVVAHRGNSAHAPEDTLESLRQGVALGADAVEFDVRLTRDGHAVVIHDPTLERTTNGAGNVADHTLGQLRALDFGYRFTRDSGRTFPYRGRGITVSTLDEVLAECGAVPMIIEVKIASASAETKRLIERHGLAKRCLVGSFDDRAVAPFTGTGIAHSGARGDVIRLFLRSLLPGGPSALPYEALCIPPIFKGLPLPILRFARMGHRAGVQTHIWTVDDPDEAKRLWDGGVNGIISNDPGRILAAIGRTNSAILPTPEKHHNG